MPAQAQLNGHAARMHGRCSGNPHSVKPASAASTELIVRARHAVLARPNGIGLDEMSRHVHSLTGHLLGGLGALRHGNGEPMICVRGPSATRDRGGTAAFSQLDPRGTLRNAWDTEQAAADAGICVRTGCSATLAPPRPPPGGVTETCAVR